MVVYTGGAAVADKAAFTGALAGAATGALNGILSGNTAVQAGELTLRTLVAKSVGSGAVVGAVTGVVTGHGVNTITNVLTGAVTSAASSASLCFATAGAVAQSMSVVLGSIPAWLILGASCDKEAPSNSASYSYDCWKPILHDISPEPSEGLPLVDVLHDNRIKNITTDEYLKHLYVTNKWDETFQINFLNLANGTIAAHAVVV